MLKQIEEIRLTENQQMLLIAFYDALRESPQGGLIPYATLERIANSISYESDLAIGIMQRLNDYLVKLRNDKIKADEDKLRLGK